MAQQFVVRTARIDHQGKDGALILDTTAEAKGATS